MKRLVWSQDAEADLDSITDYIARDDVMAAIGVRDEIERQVQRLCRFALSGREGRLEGTRELVVARTPFIVVYAAGETVLIVRVLHGAQRWPPRI
ncbi:MULTISPECIES: type II toxin-antitoxin system RelE/ParE family toxin [unclassified Mesorhizobium]|uniref:type II toxin-antitoxin system RelE/ParE family toxin n=1 Tax=unclassified Mesorhizobium TaxID=325217 RepID=UPI000FE7EB1A|nr:MULTISPECIES: type II toxin-antitoxin system RelE/ParE family toxin [unclassified Mesorhizobium]RWI14083.1 MAG: type II toxin-antitoxin system RelE/ParE family toxin [Mesorhizobium sp.]RWK46245.1 MAG: type II toxin-antitoxin system RelE/ParE family toxin [Mesorhizobium sp.]RWK92242.1 MAG: type II toxin-antitoxin system RelE/ParE family toxin [Mesorhizobium sp.]RWL01307.1 MAG: type II toxin-antitoxin system RelE/ParE family toxin [Mesorhizobium sp.]TIP60599.1 MAG: type II toxin-antitoxin sys